MSNENQLANTDPTGSLYFYNKISSRIDRRCWPMAALVERQLLAEAV